MAVKKKVERWPSANFPRSSRIKKNEEDFIKMLSLRKLFIASTLLCATIMALGQGQQARTSSASSTVSTGTSVILCMPGLVYRCNKFGCFCVRP